MSLNHNSYYLMEECPDCGEELMARWNMIIHNNHKIENYSNKGIGFWSVNCESCFLYEDEEDFFDLESLQKKYSINLSEDD